MKTKLPLCECQRVYGPTELKGDDTPEISASEVAEVAEQLRRLPRFDEVYFQGMSWLDETVEADLPPQLVEGQMVVSKEDEMSGVTVLVEGPPENPRVSIDGETLRGVQRLTIDYTTAHTLPSVTVTFLAKSVIIEEHHDS